MKFLKMFLTNQQFLAKRSLNAILKIFNLKIFKNNTERTKVGLADYMMP